MCSNKNGKSKFKHFFTRLHYWTLVSLSVSSSQICRHRLGLCQLSQAGVSQRRLWSRVLLSLQTGLAPQPDLRLSPPTEGAIPAHPQQPLAQLHTGAGTRWAPGNTHRHTPQTPCRGSDITTVSYTHTHTHTGTVCVCVCLWCRHKQTDKIFSPRTSVLKIFFTPLKTLCLCQSLSRLPPPSVRALSQTRLASVVSTPRRSHRWLKRAVLNRAWDTIYITVSPLYSFITAASCILSQHFFIQMYTFSQISKLACWWGFFNFLHSLILVSLQENSFTSAAHSQRYLKQKQSSVCSRHICIMKNTVSELHFSNATNNQTICSWKPPASSTVKFWNSV